MEQRSPINLIYPDTFHLITRIIILNEFSVYDMERRLGVELFEMNNAEEYKLRVRAAGRLLIDQWVDEPAPRDERYMPWLVVQLNGYNPYIFKHLSVVGIYEDGLTLDVLGTWITGDEYEDAYKKIKNRLYLPEITRDDTYTNRFRRLLLP